MWLVLVAAVVAVAGGSVWIVYKRHRNSGKGEDGKAVRQDKEQLPEASDVKVEKMAVDTGTVNSMYLFGDFSVSTGTDAISPICFPCVSSRYSVSFAL